MIRAMEFEYNQDITAISEKQFDAHYKLYQGYINKTNEIVNKLSGESGERADANSIYSYYRGLKESESFAIDACILHELYFENIGGGSSAPHENTIKMVNRLFGSFDNFLSNLKSCCMAARGWGLLVFEPRTATFRNAMLDAHNVGITMLSQPILVIDMYEHAYFYDYLTDKESYIDAVIDNINWDIVEKRTDFLLSHGR